MVCAIWPNSLPARVVAQVAVAVGMPPKKPWRRPFINNSLLRPDRFRCFRPRNSGQQFAQSLIHAGEFVHQTLRESDRVGQFIASTAMFELTGKFGQVHGAEVGTG